MARRVSGGGGNIDEASLGLSVCNSQLETLARRVQNDCKDFSAEKLTGWKQAILSHAKAAAVVGYKANIAKNVMQEERVKERDPASEESETIDTLTKNMLKRIADRSAKYDGIDGVSVKKIAGIVKIKLGDEDEDIELVSEEYQESSFKCSFTTQRFVEPYSNGKCIHRVSKCAIASVLQSGRCHQPGCQARWTRENCQPDLAFQAEMERFFKNKDKAASSSAQAKGENEDDGYAQL